MIVKNESHVIRRCLDSVRPLLHAWCVVDTGSTDGTQDLIREMMMDLPGELFERPWVDFAFNRNEAIGLAHGRADYLLFIDADEYLVFSSDFGSLPLDEDAYAFAVRTGPVVYWKTQLVRDALPWRFIGAMHEYIAAEGARPEIRLTEVVTRRVTDGARSRDPLTPRRDALVLEGALLQEPANTRHMFYLAQSYTAAGEIDLAIDRYRKRAAMESQSEEAWYSLFQIARLLEAKGSDWPLTLEAYLSAYGARPTRAEPLFYIGFHYTALRQFTQAYLFLSTAVKIPYPTNDQVFIDQEVYDRLVPLEYSVCCYYVGLHREAIDACNRLLENPDLTPAQVQQVTRNRQFSLDALGETAEL